MIERPAERNDAGAAEQSICRLQAGNSTSGRRYPDRAAGVGSQSTQAFSAGNRRRRTAAAPARYVGGIPGISGRWSNRPKGELMRIGFASVTAARLRNRVTTAASRSGTKSGQYP